MADPAESRRAGGATTARAADGREYLRIPLSTRWVEPGDDLAPLAREHVEPVREPGDVLLVSEKVMAVALGRGIPAEQLRPGRLARLLSRAVGAPMGAVGLNVPEKMQYVVETAGAPRVIVAAIAAAVTRPLGRTGVFHRVVGGWCRDIDGMCPPYEREVIPPLAAVEARDRAEDLAADLGMGVAIIDLNDSGGRIRATARIPASELGPDESHLISALTGNPLGQRRRSTPIGLLRRLEPAHGNERAMDTS